MPGERPQGLPLVAVMSEEDDCVSRPEEETDGGQSGPDPEIMAHPSMSNGHVEINPEQNPLEAKGRLREIVEHLLISLANFG